MIKTVIIDAGHGGIDAQGRYTTAPAKMHTFSNGEVAYEGVYNRKIARFVYVFLKYNTSIKSVFTVRPDDPTDISLRTRTNIANEYDKTSSLLLSLHSNASPTHTARGFEIITSKGLTKSDYIATCIGNEIIKGFSKQHIKFRKDLSDGDLDKEMDLHVLRNSKCYAILLETLFFDQYDDFKLLRNTSFQMRTAWYIVKGILAFNKKYNYL